MPQKSLTVIHTIASMQANAGGPSRSVRQLLDNLVQEDVKVCLLTTKSRVEEDDWVAQIKRNVEVQVVPSYYWQRGRILFAPEFRRRLATMCRAAHSPVILHDHGVWLHTHHDCACVAKSLGISRVVSPRGSLMQWPLNYKALKKKLAWAAYQRRDVIAAKVIHATSPEEADDMRSIGIKRPIAVIPNGVVLPTLSPIAKTHPPTVLFLSRLTPKKGLLNLVAAWAQVRPIGWRCVIAGPDEANYRATVEQAVLRAGLQSEFCFCGPVADDQKWPLYASARIFVLPTFNENFGIVVAEALACGVPVITTKGAPWSDLEAYRCGWWIDIGVDSLANALRKAMAISERECAEMGDRGHRLVKEKYAWQPIAHQMIEVYQWIIAGGRPPACVSLT